MKLGPSKQLKFIWNILAVCYLYKRLEWHNSSCSLANGSKQHAKGNYITELAVHQNFLRKEIPKSWLFKDLWSIELCHIFLIKLRNIAFPQFVVVNEERKIGQKSCFDSSGGIDIKVTRKMAGKYSTETFPSFPIPLLPKPRWFGSKVFIVIYVGNCMSFPFNILHQLVALWRAMAKWHNENFRSSISGN